MKNIVRWILIIATIIIIALAAIRFIAPSVFFSYIYPFNRIKGIVTLNIDGKEVPLSECVISCSRSNEPEKIHISNDKIKIRAGKKGNYNFRVTNGNTEILFYIQNYNCWNCVDFDVSFSLETQNELIFCNGSASALNNKGFKTDLKPFSITTDLEYNNSQNGICIY